MAIDTYTNCEAFFDGTSRWLWQVIHKDRTWRAGVSCHAQEAQRSADMALAELEAGIRAGKVSVQSPATTEPMLDLDAVDPNKVPE